MNKLRILWAIWYLDSARRVGHAESVMHFGNVTVFVSEGGSAITSNSLS